MQLNDVRIIFSKKLKLLKIMSVGTNGSPYIS